MFCHLVFIAFEGSALIQQIDMNDSEMLLSQNVDNKMQKKKMNWLSSSSNDIQTKKATTSEIFPFMDHWNAQTQKVSLRQIISEEIAMQEKEDLVWISPFLCSINSLLLMKQYLIWWLIFVLLITAWIREINACQLVLLITMIHTFACGRFSFFKSHLKV